MNCVTHPLRRGIILAAPIICASFFTSCSVYLPTHAVNQPKPQPALYEWWGDNLDGPASVSINLSEQKATIYRGGQQAGWTMLASGTSKHPTPTGSFSVMEKIVDKVSNTYGVITNSEGEVVNWDAQAGVTPVPKGCRFVGAQMPYWMRLTGGGVGMHAGDIPDPGLPASHGCIRLPRDFAGTLFSVVNVGTRVTISGSIDDASPMNAPHNRTARAQTRNSGTAPDPVLSMSTLR